MAAAQRPFPATSEPVCHRRSWRRAALAFGLGAAILGAGAPATPVRADGGIASMAATYRIHFAGLNLGRAKVSSELRDGRYKMHGTTRLEFLGGILWELRGGSNSTGDLTAEGPAPSKFSFHFNQGRKSGKLAMSFAGNAVRKVDSDIPEPKDRSRFVPVTEDHLVGVLDPLTAVFQMVTDPAGTAPKAVCDRRVPVFDGKHRFDLQLSHKQNVRVQRNGKSGYEGPAVICQVKYIPIAGYKTSQEGVRFVANSDAIEIWLIPVPDAGVSLPYHVTVPTPYGAATATSASFQVELESRRRIVLVN